MIEWINQSGQAWAAFFGVAVLQNTLFLGIVFLVLYSFRNASARIRHAIAMIGIIKLLLPPFLPASLLSQWFAFPVATIDIQIGKPMVAAAAEMNEPTLQVSLIGLVFLIWLITFSISLIFPVVSTLRLRLKLKNARPIRLDDFENIRIQVYQSEKIAMPLTVGFFSIKIFVPAQWENWSVECRKMILHHEIAHIKRKDGLFQLIQMVAQAVYFFHPLVWILNSRINRYREMACDDASVATKRNSNMEYSRYLVTIAEEMTLSELGCASASALIRQRNELLNRINYQIMDVAMKHISKKKLGAILTMLLLSFGLLSFTFSSSSPLDEPEIFAVQKTGKVYGTIKAKETGKPIKEVKVSIDGTSLWAVSDDGGNFFIVNVPSGIYNLSVSKPGYKAVQVSKIEVKEALNTKVDFVLESKLTKISETGKEEPPPPPPPAKEKLIKGDETEKGEVPPPPPQKMEGWVTIVVDKTNDIQPRLDKKETEAEHGNPPEVVGGLEEVAKVLQYPESARKAGITGTVQVGVQINEKGKVLEAVIIESLNADCDKAAIEALNSVKWKAGIKDGKPVKVWISIPVKFNL